MPPALPASPRREPAKAKSGAKSAARPAPPAPKRTASATSEAAAAAHKPAPKKGAAKPAGPKSAGTKPAAAKQAASKPTSSKQAAPKPISAERAAAKRGPSKKTASKAGAGAKALAAERAEPKVQRSSNAAPTRNTTGAPAPSEAAIAPSVDDAAALTPTAAPRGAAASRLIAAESPAPAAPAAAPTASLDDVPEVPRGPYAQHATDDLWVLYRAEVRRLRAVDAAAAAALESEADSEDELDEDAELRRLESAARAEAAREAALARDAARGNPEPLHAATDGDAAESEPIEVEAPRPTRGARVSPELERLRNELIERHYPLVRYIAERLLQTLPKSIELDDLISAGQFGLMDAIRGFDPGRGIKFKTYCSTRIRGSILDQLRSQDWVPRLVRLKATRIDKALQRLTGEFGREPTHAELARALELEHGELSREIMESQARTMFSLSEKWDDDDEGSVEKVEILEDRTAIDPVHELNRRDLMLFMTRSLTHKERFIIEQYYQYGHTMREIGEMLTLTESRVCQIHSNVMARLKSLLAQRGDALSG